MTREQRFTPSFYFHKKRHVALLEVMIAFALTALCALPLLYSQIMITKVEKQFLDTIELDHAANLIFANILQNLYERKIPFAEILNGQVIDVEQTLLEQSGVPSSMDLKSYYQFVLKNKKPPESDTKQWYLFTLTLGFKSKEEKKIEYTYLVTIEHQK